MFAAVNAAGNPCKKVGSDPPLSAIVNMLECCSALWQDWIMRLDNVVPIAAFVGAMNSLA